MLDDFGVVGEGSTRENFVWSWEDRSRSKLSNRGLRRVDETQGDISLMIPKSETAQRRSRGVLRFAQNDVTFSRCITLVWL
jgi:hypothetical protein